MNLADLEKILPIKKDFQDGYESFQIEDRVVYVDPQDLSSRELEILELFCPVGLDPSKLFHGLEDKKYRILHFKSEDFGELDTVLEELLTNIFKRSQGIYLEEFTGENLTLAEYEEIFEALENDFDLRFDYYIGSFTDRDDLESVYSKESQNFEQGYHSLQEASIKLLGQALLDSSLVFEKLKDKLEDDIKSVQVIDALYDSDGSRSKAAKSLFIHRNTLNQKIKKVEVKYGVKLDSQGVLMLKSLI